MLILLLFLYFLPSGNLRGERQLPIEEWSIPDFAQTRFHASRLSQSLKISYALNPFYQSGDFDGDGKLDVALLVKNKSSGKTGIAIIHSGPKPIVLLGAGTSWNNDPKYDFDWMDAWQIYPKSPVGQGAGEGKPPTLRGDAILAIKTESASGLIYWDGTKYKWYQQGD
jgi:hypothetical protein